jgi:hypothetical protein
MLTTAECWWLMPIILATQEAESWRSVVQSQPRQIVRETVWGGWGRKKKKKKNHHKKRAGGVAQGVGPEFKPQYHKKKKKCPPR